MRGAVFVSGWVVFVWHFKLKFSCAVIHIAQLAPSRVFDFAEKQTGAHFGVVARTVVLPVGYFEMVAKVVQTVAAEVVKSAGGA